MPLPSALDDGIERLELRSPTELLFQFFGRSDKPWRITRSAWLFHRLDFLPGDFAAGRDYLSNTAAASSAEIVESAGGCAESQNVCKRKIHNMNVVANTCAVGRLI